MAQLESTLRIADERDHDMVEIIRKLKQSLGGVYLDDLS